MKPAASPRPGAALARFCEARGQRVLDLEGVLWAEYRPPFYMSLPYEARMDLDAGAVAAALRAKRVVGVRHPTVTQPGWPCGLFACETQGYSLDRVERRHRKQVQKGLERCTIRDVDPDELLAEGLQLNLETMARQGRSDPELADPARWRRFVAAIRDCPEVTVTGAFLDGRISAYAVLCRDGAWLHVLYRMTRTADMIHRTNPALDYSVLAQAARDPTLGGVTNSWLSLIRGSEGLHHYKQLMGYRIERHALAIRLHPALARALTSRPAVAAAAALARLRPGSARAALVARVLEGARMSRRPSRKAPAGPGAEAHSGAR